MHTLALARAMKWLLQILQQHQASYLGLGYI